jgi:hypothetical protein
VRAAYDGRPGHPVALARSLFPAVAALRGDVGARDLLDAAATRTVEVGHLCRPDDVDVPADLEALRSGVGVDGGSADGIRAKEWVAPSPAEAAQRATRRRRSIVAC